MRGQLGHSTRPHTRLLFSFLGMDAWMTLQLNTSSIRKRGSLICLAYLLTSFLGVCTTSHRADVRSTGAGIKCLYCICICVLYGEFPQESGVTFLRSRNLFVYVVNKVLQLPREYLDINAPAYPELNNLKAESMCSKNERNLRGV